MHICLIDSGIHLPSLYMYCPRSSFGCSGMHGICAQLTGGHLPSIYRHCPRSNFGCSGMHGICTQLTGEGHMKCNGIQYICAWLTRESICLLYICIVLDLAMDVAACKASVLRLNGEGHMKFNGIQGICAWLTQGSICLSIYMHCPRSSSGCSGMQVIYTQMTGGSICLLYICTVLDLAVDAVVCKASLLNWLGRTYAGLHCAMLI